MIKLSQAIIVEGKYDKIKLSGIVDTLIIETNGFGIFKDKEKASLIKHLAETCGIIIMTDSDSAGLQLRNKIQEIASKGIVYNAYIPEILGKEKRKVHPSKQGLLGVEGVNSDVIISALNRCGIEYSNNTACDDLISDLTLYNLGITGGNDSKKLRIELLKYLELPTGMSKNNLLKILQMQMSIPELENIINMLRRDA